MGVSLAILPSKGYGAPWTVRLEINGPDRKMRKREKQGGAAAGGEGGRGGAAIADEAEVAGEGREGATGHGFPNRKLLKKEEDEGNSLPASERPGKRPSCRAMAGGGELLRRARPGCLETSFCSRIGWGESGREEEAHQNNERGEKGSKRRDDVRRRLLLRRRFSAQGRAEQGKEKREWGRGSARVRAGLSTSSRDAGGSGRDRGRGGAASSVRNREREGGAVGEEGEGTDKRGPLVGEREGKGGERPAGPRPRKGRERRGEELGRKAEPREKRGKGKFHFFPKQFFKLIFQMYRVPVQGCGR